MSGTPLTKPLHNGSLQAGTGVSCMRCKRGSTGFTAVQSLFQTRHHRTSCMDGTGHVFAGRVRLVFLLLQAPHTARHLQLAKKHRCRRLAPVLTTGARGLPPPRPCHVRNQPEPCLKRHRSDPSQDGSGTLLQIKQLKFQQVGASVVSEMHGLPAYHHMDSIRFLSGKYTETLSGLRKVSRLSL